MGRNSGRNERLFRIEKESPFYKHEIEKFICNRKYLKERLFVKKRAYDFCRIGNGAYGDTRAFTMSLVLQKECAQEEDMITENVGSGKGEEKDTFVNEFRIAEKRVRDLEDEDFDNEFCIAEDLSLLVETGAHTYGFPMVYGSDVSSGKLLMEHCSLRGSAIFSKYCSKQRIERTGIIQSFLGQLFFSLSAAYEGAEYFRHYDLRLPNVVGCEIPDGFSVVCNGTHELEFSAKYGLWKWIDFGVASTLRHHNVRRCFDYEFECLTLRQWDELSHFRNEMLCHFRTQHNKDISKCFPPLNVMRREFKKMSLQNLAAVSTLSFLWNVYENSIFYWGEFPLDLDPVPEIKETLETYTQIFQYLHDHSHQHDKNYAHFLHSILPGFMNPLAFRPEKLMSNEAFLNALGAKKITEIV